MHNSSTAKLGYKTPPVKDFHLRMENSKRTVKKISNTDNYTLIRAIVIGIVYREKIKERHNMLQRPSN